MRSSLLSSQATTLLKQWLDQESPDFEALAAFFMSHGYGSDAARCQTWSLLPPSPAVWTVQRQRWLDQIQLVPDAPLPRTEGVQPERFAGRVEADLQAIQRLVEAGQTAAACARIADLSHESQLAPHLCNRTAMLYASLGLAWEAERWYRTSLVQQHNQPQCWFALARLLLQQEACDEALEAATIGLEIHPDHPWGLKLRQRALEGLGAFKALHHLSELGPLPYPLPEPTTVDRAGFEGCQAYAATLPDRLSLCHVLGSFAAPIWCVGPSSHQFVLWLAAQKLLQRPTPLHVFADPDADHADWSDAALAQRVGQSLPLYWMQRSGCCPGLAVLAPTNPHSCNLSVRCLMDAAIPLVVDARWQLELADHREVIHTQHWSLYLPKSGMHP